MQALNINVIQEVAPHFYDIGLELGVEEAELRIIRTDHPQQCRKSCQIMFEKYLKKDGATWKEVIDGLRCDAVKLLYLAGNIEKDLPSLLLIFKNAYHIH